MIYSAVQLFKFSRVFVEQELTLFDILGPNPVWRNGRLVQPGEEIRQKFSVRIDQTPNQRGNQGRGEGNYLINEAN